MEERTENIGYDEEMTFVNDPAVSNIREVLEDSSLKGRVPEAQILNLENISKGIDKTTELLKGYDNELSSIMNEPSTPEITTRINQLRNKIAIEKNNLALYDKQAEQEISKIRISTAKVASPEMKMRIENLSKSFKVATKNSWLRGLSKTLSRGGPLIASLLVNAAAFYAVDQIEEPYIRIPVGMAVGALVTTIFGGGWVAGLIGAGLYPLAELIFGDPHPLVKETLVDPTDPRIPVTERKLTQEEEQMAELPEQDRRWGSLSLPASNFMFWANACLQIGPSDPDYRRRYTIAKQEFMNASSNTDLPDFDRETIVRTFRILEEPIEEDPLADVIVADRNETFESHTQQKNVIMDKYNAKLEELYRAYNSNNVQDIIAIRKDLGNLIAQLREIHEYDLATQKEIELGLSQEDAAKQRQIDAFYALCRRLKRATNEDRMSTEGDDSYDKQYAILQNLIEEAERSGADNATISKMQQELLTVPPPGIPASPPPGIPASPPPGIPASQPSSPVSVPSPGKPGENPGYPTPIYIDPGFSPFPIYTENMYVGYGQGYDNPGYQLTDPNPGLQQLPRPPDGTDMESALVSLGLQALNRVSPIGAQIVSQFITNGRIDRSKFKGPAVVGAVAAIAGAGYLIFEQFRYQLESSLKISKFKTRTTLTMSGLNVWTDMNMAPVLFNRLLSTISLVVVVGTEEANNQFTAETPETIENALNLIGYALTEVRTKLQISLNFGNMYALEALKSIIESSQKDRLAEIYDNTIDGNMKGTNGIKISIGNLCISLRNMLNKFIEKCTDEKQRKKYEALNDKVTALEIYIKETHNYCVSVLSILKREPPEQASMYQDLPTLPIPTSPQLLPTNERKFETLDKKPETLLTYEEAMKLFDEIKDSWKGIHPEKPFMVPGTPGTRKSDLDNWKDTKIKVMKVLSITYPSPAVLKQMIDLYTFMHTAEDNTQITAAEFRQNVDAKAEAILNATVLGAGNKTATEPTGNTATQPETKPYTTQPETKPYFTSDDDITSLLMLSSKNNLLKTWALMNMMKHSSTNIALPLLMLKSHHTHLPFEKLSNFDKSIDMYYEHTLAWNEPHNISFNIIKQLELKKAGITNWAIKSLRFTIQIDNPLTSDNEEDPSQAVRLVIVHGNNEIQPLLNKQLLTLNQEEQTTPNKWWLFDELNDKKQTSNVFQMATNPTQENRVLFDAAHSLKKCKTASVSCTSDLYFDNQNKKKYTDPRNPITGKQIAPADVQSADGIWIIALKTANVKEDTFCTIKGWFLVTVNPIAGDLLSSELFNKHLLKSPKFSISFDVNKSIETQIQPKRILPPLSMKGILSHKRPSMENLIGTGDAMRDAAFTIGRKRSRSHEGLQRVSYTTKNGKKIVRYKDPATNLFVSA